MIKKLKRRKKRNDSLPRLRHPQRADTFSTRFRKKSLTQKLRLSEELLLLHHHHLRPRHLLLHLGPLFYFRKRRGRRLPKHRKSVKMYVAVFFHLFAETINKKSINILLETSSTTHAKYLTLFYRKLTDSNL